MPRATILIASLFLLLGCPDDSGDDDSGDDDGGDDDGGDDDSGDDDGGDDDGGDDDDGGPNIKISQGGDFNGEPTIAVNPANPENIIAAWMHMTEVASEEMEIQVASSQDRGASWSSPTSLGHVDPVYTLSADVSVAFDRAGMAHMTYIEIEPDPEGNLDCEFQLKSGEVVHRRSVDGGVTWSPAVRVRHSDETEDFAIDRPWVAVDRSGGIRDGWVYVVSISFYCNHPGPPQHVHLKWSADQGASWSDSVQVDNAEYSTGSLADYPFPAVIGIGGDGALWVVYPRVAGTLCNTTTYTCLLAAVSSDGGQSFTRSKVADVDPGGDHGFGLWHTLAADLAAPGHCAVFWPDDGSEPLGADILFTRSEDGGQSWSAPVRVNDNPPGQGIGMGQPWAAADTEGNLAVMWRDRRAAGSGAEVAFEAYTAISLDGGGSFLPNQRLSDQPSPYGQVNCCNSFEGLSLGGGWLHADWGDLRDGTWEIYYARAPVGSGK